MTAPTPRAIALVALSIAEGYAAAGVHEEGGNNRGDQVEFFQRLMGGAPGDSWCADFVSTCEVKAVARVLGKPEDRASLPSCVRQAGALMLPLSGSCRDIEASARAKGLLRGPDFSPCPGDLVLMDIPDAHGRRKGYSHHIGMVKAWPETIEGNTSNNDGGSQADGGGVYEKTRSREDVRFFVHFG